MSWLSVLWYVIFGTRCKSLLIRSLEEVLTIKIKLLGWIPEDGIQLSKNISNLVNWPLTIARFSIHKATVQFRIGKEVTPILPIFGAVAKSIIRFQFKGLCVKRNAISLSWSMDYWICVCKTRDQCLSLDDVRDY